MNYKLTIQYDGTDFHGWQIQDGLRTVQGELTKALTLLEGEPVTVQGSGRTDAGVHAEGQVANVVLGRAFTPEKLRAAINGNVDDDLRVVAVADVGDDFHARYSATGKTYLYRIINGPVVSPFWRRYAHQESRPLDVEAMADVAQVFLGTHDWTAFSAAQAEVEDRIRTLTHVSVVRRVDERASQSLIEIQVSGNGFLRYMVRSIAGTLLAVGRHELGREEVSTALSTGVRPRPAVTAPACGLTLISVCY